MFDHEELPPVQEMHEEREREREMQKDPHGAIHELVLLTQCK